jgi:hypothetical protein
MFDSRPEKTLKEHHTTADVIFANSLKYQNKNVQLKGIAQRD